MKEIIIDYPNSALLIYLSAAAPSGLSFVTDYPSKKIHGVFGDDLFKFAVNIDLNLISIEPAVRYLVDRSIKSGQLIDFEIDRD